MKYTLVVGRVVQEKFKKEVRKKPRFLGFDRDIFKTQDMCDKVVEVDTRSCKYVPDHLKHKACVKKPLKKTRGY